MKWITRNTSWIIMALVIIGYSFYGAFVLRFNDTLNLNDLLIIIAINLSLAITLNSAMLNQGEIDGNETDEVKSALNTFNNTYDKKLTGRLNKVDPFTSYKNESALKLIRTNILKEVALEYNDYFNVYGKFIGEYIQKPKLTEINKTYYKKLVKDVKDKNRSIRNAMRRRPKTILSRTDITSTLDIDRSMDPLKRVKSKESHKRKTSITSVISKVFMIVSFTLIVVDGFNGKDILSRMVLLLSIVAGSLLEYIKIYIYMKHTYPKRIQETTDYIEELYQMDVSGELDEYIKGKEILKSESETIDIVQPEASNELRMDDMIKEE